MRATTIAVLGLGAALPVGGCGTGGGVKKITEMAEAVCACYDKACSKEKLELVTSYVKDYQQTDAWKKAKSKDHFEITDQLSHARTCAARNGVGPFVKR